MVAALTPLAMVKKPSIGVQTPQLAAGLPALMPLGVAAPARTGTQGRPVLFDAAKNLGWSERESVTQPLQCPGIQQFLEGFREIIAQIIVTSFCPRRLPPHRRFESSD
jgi:hypothetical protein